MSDPVLFLYLEDNPRDAELVRDKLQRTALAHELRIANGRAEYEAALAQARFDLILSDYSLPDYDGMTALALAREKQPDVPFIIISGTLGEDQAVDCVVRGATDYVLKQNLNRLVPAVLRALTEGEEHRKRRATEEALRASEDRFRSLFESSRDAIMILEPPSWRFTAGNPATARMFGVKNEEEFVSRGPWELSPERQPDGRASAEKSAEMIVTALRDGSHFFEWKHRRVGGEEFPCDVLLTRMEQSGKVLLQATVRDITERKRAEVALREDEQMVNAIVESSRDWIWAIDRTGRHTYSNRAVESILGYSPAEFQGMGLDLLHPDDKRLTEAEWPGLVEERRGWRDRVLRWRAKDGSYRHLESTAVPILDPKGELLGFRGVDRDITERWRAEEALHHNQAMLARTEGLAHIGSWEWDVATDTVTWSDELFRIFQRNPADGAPSFVEHSKFYHPDDMQRLRSAVEAALSHGTPYMMELRALRKDGATRVCLARGHAEIRPGERATRLFGSLHDITERKRAEEEAAHSAALLRDVVDMVPAYICAKNSEGRFLLVNRRLADFYGIPVDTMTGMLHADLCEDKEELRSMLAADLQVMESGRAEVIAEETMKKPDGTMAVLETYKIPFTADGNPAVLIASADITERKRVEKALCTEHERLENVLSATRTGIDIIDGEFNLHFVDRGWQKIYGDPTGRKCYEYFNGLSAPCPGCGIPKALETKQAVIKEEVMPRENHRPVEVHTLPFQNAEGQWLVAEINIDITERKRAGEALKASEMRFKELLLHVPTVAVQGYALDGTVRYWNRAAEVFYGYTAEEALAHNLLELIIPPARRDGVKAAIRRMAETGETIPAAESELMRKDGALIPIYSSHALVHLPGQEPELFCFDIDLTELRKTEAEREKLQAHLRQAQKMEAVGRLAGGVAHDFNNLLMGIMNYVELCRDKTEPDHPIREYLDEITHDAERSAELTRQLLAFARKQTIAPRVLDLNDTVAGMLKLLRRLIGEDIKLAWRPGVDLRPVRIDPSQVDQILANLCVNARDAIAGVGEVTLETGSIAVDAEYCARHPEAIPGAYVFLAVSDDGCGMDKETLALVFEPFFTTKGLGKGTGLGLATVYGIVRQNNGFIYVYSEPGRGTTFKICLPEIAAEVEARVTSKAEAPRGRGETILLVEDEKSLRVTCGLFLEALGYKVLVAETPGEALKMVAGHPGDIHVLLTDVVMPGMDGRQLAHRIGAVKPGVKVLFMSGYTADVIAQRGVLEEGVQFLSKPFPRDVLARKVREVLEG